jgi:recombination protein RecA
MPKDGEKTGRESKFKIYKSALGPGTGEAVFYIRYNHGYDWETDVFNTAESLGFITKAGAWYSIENSKEEEIKVQGRESLIQYFRDHPDEALIMESKVKNIFFPAKK